VPSNGTSTRAAAGDRPTLKSKRRLLCQQIHILIADKQTPAKVKAFQLPLRAVRIT